MSAARAMPGGGMACRGVRFASGLWADPCVTCERRAAARQPRQEMEPAARFVDEPERVGWHCNHQIKDRPGAR